ncbi:DMT family transporter [Oleidesulfovibrio alaskensis]|uniref:DMT family transporter n=1 Tax=Oleidesulfovibrio alaskensis TaxID=58180 RepID=UPI001A50ABBF|nr:DMT family transporter [Oleidesulfovibrio alaskensis]MBL3582538.1 DMT family transporter [Oleidesulfovibrio alaskensis]
MQEGKGIGYVAAFAAIVLWSGNFVVARLLNEALSPLATSFWRWGIASAALLPLGWSAFRRDWPAIVAHKWYFLLTAFVGITIFNTMVYMAGRTSAAVNLSLIATSSPVFMFLFARIFLGEAISPRRVAGLVVALCGVLVLISRGHVQALLQLEFTQGDLWMLLAAVCFAVYSVLARQRPQGVSQSAFLVATFIPGLIMLTPAYVADAWAGPAVQFTPLVVGCLLYIGLGASLTAYFLWNKAVGILGSSLAGVLYYSIPVFAGLAAYLLLGEPVGFIHLASGLLVIGGILLATRG